MGDKVLASSIESQLREFSNANGIPVLKVNFDSENKYEDLTVHVAAKDTNLTDFLGFCKGLGASHFVFSDFSFELTDLEDLKNIEANEDGDEDEDDGGDDGEGLSPKAEKIVLDSIKRQAKELEGKAGQVGSVEILAFKDKSAFRLGFTDEWYDRYLLLSEAGDDLEENGPEILSSDEIVKFNKEVGIRESKESIMARRQEEIEKRKTEFFTALSNDKVFLNAKNLTLKMARADRTMPDTLWNFVNKRDAVDAANDLFLQRIGDLKASGKTPKEISTAVGVSEKMLKKYLDLD